MPFVSYARNAEDVVLWRALSSVEHGTYIDIGAGEGDGASATRALYERGWSGVTAEPVAERHAALLRQRGRDVALNVAVAARAGIVRLVTVPSAGLVTTSDAVADEAGRSGWPVEIAHVPALTLADICTHLNSADIHLLKISTDGSEREVLGGADLSAVRPWVILVHARCGLRQARQDAELRDALAPFGYDPVLFDGVNLFFVARERAHLAPALSVPANSLDDYIPAALAAAEADAERGRAAAEEARYRQAERDRLEAELAALRRQAPEAEQMMARLRSENIALQREAAERGSNGPKVQGLQRELYEAQHRIQGLEFRVRSQEAALGAIDDLLAEMVRQGVAEFEFGEDVPLHDRVAVLIEHYQSQIEAVSERAATLEGHRDQILSSRSWRLTAPLRKLLTAVRVARQEPDQFLALVRHNVGRRFGAVGPVATAPVPFDPDPEPIEPETPVAAAQQEDRAERLAFAIRLEVEKRRTHSSLRAGRR